MLSRTTCCWTQSSSIWDASPISSQSLHFAGPSCGKNVLGETWAYQWLAWYFIWMCLIFFAGTGTFHIFISLGHSCLWLNLFNTEKHESMQLQHLNFVGASMISSPTGYCCSGSQVRKEAWKVRRLVSEFSKAARRPHWPREHAMQVLFRTAGISNWREADGSFHYLINIYFLICFILNQVLLDSVVKKCSYMCPLKNLAMLIPRYPRGRWKWTWWFFRTGRGFRKRWWEWRWIPKWDNSNWMAFTIWVWLI